MRLRRDLSESVLQYIPFGLFFLVMFIIHINITIGIYDDAFFAAILDNQSFFGYLMERYQIWTSRLFIEGVLIVVSRFHILWRIADTLIMLGISLFFSWVFNSEKKHIVNWFIVFLMMAFPFGILNTAGWIATTLNYTWPFAAGLVSLIPIIKYYRNEEVSNWQLAISFILLLFAANQEQMCAVLIAIIFYSIVMMKINKRQISKFIIVEFIISLLSLVFIMTCPGNDARTITETQTRFPEFAELSLLTKIDIGFASTMFPMLTQIDCTFLIFVTLLPFAVFSIKGVKPVLIASVYPLLITLLFGVFGSFLESRISIIALFRNGLETMRTNTVFVNLLILTVLVSVCLVIWFYYEDKKKAFFLIFILGLGFATRMVMAFSPTIWASSTRTYCFLYFAFIIASIILFKDAFSNSKVRPGIYYVMGILTVHVANYWITLLVSLI